MGIRVMKSINKYLVISIIAWFISYLYINVVYTLGLERLGILVYPMFFGILLILNKRIKNEMISFEFLINEFKRNIQFRICTAFFSFGFLLMLISIVLKLIK